VRFFEPLVYASPESAPTQPRTLGNGSLESRYGLDPTVRSFLDDCGSARRPWIKLYTALWYKGSLTIPLANAKSRVPGRVSPPKVRPFRAKPARRPKTGRRARFASRTQPPAPSATSPCFPAVCLRYVSPLAQFHIIQEPQPQLLKGMNGVYNSSEPR
jgi:hypothetical protein